MGTLSVKSEVLVAGGEMDHLPLNARVVRIYGPPGSGKTICGQRIVRQAVDAGGRATVIRTHPPVRSLPDEYALRDVDLTSVELLDASGLESGCGLATLAARIADRGGQSVTVIVDAAVPFPVLGTVVTELHKALSARADATLVVVDDQVRDFPDVSFEVEIVLPGGGIDLSSERVSPGNPAVMWSAFQRLTNDEATLKRLIARIDQAPAARAVEGLQPGIVVGRTATWPGKWLRHGFIRTQDGGVAEFVLPTLLTPSVQ